MKAGTTQGSDSSVGPESEKETLRLWGWGFSSRTGAPSAAPDLSLWTAGKTRSPAPRGFRRCRSVRFLARVPRTWLGAPHLRGLLGTSPALSPLPQIRQLKGMTRRPPQPGIRTRRASPTAGTATPAWAAPIRSRRQEPPPRGAPRQRWGPPVSNSWIQVWGSPAGRGSRGSLFSLARVSWTEDTGLGTLERSTVPAEV